MGNPTIAWQLTQALGKAQVERERSEEIARLYGQLESALRAEHKTYVIDGLEQAIHKWKTREFYAPYLYVGIRADFARALGVSQEASNQVFDDIVDNAMNPEPLVWGIKI